MRRLFLTGTSAWAGASSAHPARCQRSRAASPTRKASRSPDDWRIACNFVGKGHRRQGVATAALTGSLDLIAALGGGRVEGYPEGADSVPAGFLFNGALSTYERLGLRPRPQDRQTPLGRHQDGQTPQASDLNTRPGEGNSRLRTAAAKSHRPTQALTHRC